MFSSVLLRGFVSFSPFVLGISVELKLMCFSEVYDAQRQPRRKRWGGKNLERCSGAEYDHSCVVTTPQPINLVLPCLYRKNYFHFLGIWIVPQGFMKLCYG